MICRCGFDPRRRHPKRQAPPNRLTPYWPLPGRLKQTVAAEEEDVWGKGGTVKRSLEKRQSGLAGAMLGH